MFFLKIRVSYPVLDSNSMNIPFLKLTIRQANTLGEDWSGSFPPNLTCLDQFIYLSICLSVCGPRKLTNEITSSKVDYEYYRFSSKNSLPLHDLRLGFKEFPAIFEGRLNNKKNDGCWVETGRPFFVCVIFPWKDSETVFR